MCRPLDLNGRPPIKSRAMPSYIISDVFLKPSRKITERKTYFAHPNHCEHYGSGLQQISLVLLASTRIIIHNGACVGHLGSDERRRSLAPRVRASPAAAIATEAQSASHGISHSSPKRQRRDSDPAPLTIGHATASPVAVITEKPRFPTRYSS